MNKKTIFLLISLVILFFLILVWQINKAGNITIKRSGFPLIEENLVYLSVDENDFVFGNPGARNIIVEFNTFGCSKCVAYHLYLYELTKNNSKDVMLVWKNLPKEGLISNTNAISKTAYCFGEQNKFWEFTNNNINKSSIKEEEIQNLSKEYKINNILLNKCLNKDNAENKIAKDKIIAGSLNISDAPAIFVNNRKINIPNDLNIEDVIGEIIKNIE